MMISFENVSKSFGQTVALKDVSFQIEKGEFVFFVGPSGAGKTTIVRLLIKDIIPDKGKILVDGEPLANIPARKVSILRRKIGVAFQDFKLLPDRTVFENISLVLQIQSVKKEEIQKKVSKVIVLVGLDGRENAFPGELSGGEIQRMVIARAVVSKPKILFADEPTGNLDPETSWQIIALLKEINKQGTTVVIASHNVEIVNSLKARVISLKKGEIVSDKKNGSYKKL